MSRKDFAIPGIIIFLFAGIVGYFLLSGGDGTSGRGRVGGRAVDEAMAHNRVTVGEELFACPKCGGEGGFHVGFRRGTGIRERMLQVILVCPRCDFRFTVGDFHIPSGDPRPFDPTIDAGP